MVRKISTYPELEGFKEGDVVRSNNPLSVGRRTFDPFSGTSTRRNYTSEYPPGTLFTIEHISPKSMEFDEDSVTWVSYLVILKPLDPNGEIVDLEISSRDRPPFELSKAGTTLYGETKKV